MYSGVKGMNDIWPQETPYWDLVEQTARRVFRDCGFGEIRTPILESLDLFQRSVGETTDIVQKEMFTLEDRKGRKLAMRPEGTAAVVRALIQNGLDGTDQVRRYYYMGPMFRYERPQKGRLRQFHQFGAEVFGSEAPLADADLIECIWLYYEALNVTGLELQLNSLGDANCRPAFRTALAAYLGKHEAKLCDDCKRRLHVNPLRVLDCKEEGCAAIVAGAPTINDYLCGDCKTHFAQVTNLLKANGRKFTLNPRMARGLDYYNRTVFEFVADGIGAKSAVCGGGRYDGLVQEMGGKPTPAIGFAMGIERLILLLQQGKEPQQPAAGGAWIAYMGEALAPAAATLASKLRRAGIGCRFEYQAKSLKNQFARANKEGVSLVLILGEDEIKNGTVTVKQMTSGTQESVAATALIGRLQQLLGQTK